MVKGTEWYGDAIKGDIYWGSDELIGSDLGGI